ncbi:MAG: putative zinc-binding metallopeptidase [Gammaproteobacteria bacterium]
MPPFTATPPWWAGLDDEALLDLRFRDLGLKLAGSPLAPAVDRLYGELGKRGFRFRPHVWLSVEWFCPDGVPGFAIPFYLAHPRLAALERRQMHEVEGGNARWLQRILRHEAGHAIDNAYRLRRRRRWRQVFGPASRPYPSRYTPRTTSRDFVMHLGHWYAQSHPTEDFAETFAVWLAPNSTWRTDYEQWHAVRKLRFVDDLMVEIRAEPAPVRRSAQVEPLGRNSDTLREHYAAKLNSPDRTETRRYDRRLRRVFAPPDGTPGRQSAAAFLRQVRPELRRLLVRRCRLHPYLVSHVLRLVIRRCRDLELCVNQPLRLTKREALGLLEHILFDFVRRGRERYAL